VKLLDFEMPQFTRIQFVSKEAKEYWESRINKARMAKRELEYLSILHDLRDCATIHVPATDLEAKMYEYAKNGMILFPVVKVNSSMGVSHKHFIAENGQPFSWFCVLTKSMEKALEFTEAYRNEDHVKMGDLLGYPSCCSIAFSDRVSKGYFDPMFQVAESTKKDFVKNQKETFIRLNSKTPWEINPFLRYIGIKLIPHIPCSFSCEHSLKMAKQWLDLGETHKVGGLEELKEILQFSIEWDALKGIAYISTPIFKIEKNSVTCYPKYVVQKEGTLFPKYAAKGLKFPFNEFLGITLNSCKEV
jgi:hypothetical protein